MAHVTEGSMRVTVCIVGFRNSQDILNALGALGRSTYGDLEVVICENGGPQAFAELSARLPTTLPEGQPVRAFEAPSNLGYAGGVNACIRQSATADAWWVLNPDAVPDPDALSELVARLSVGDCEAVGSTIYDVDGRVDSRGGRWRTWLGRAESIDFGRPLADPASPAEIEPQLGYLSGASMLVSRRFLEVAGEMREDYFLYAEEVEWCLRGKAKGLRLGMSVAANVLHHQGTTTGSVSDLRQRGRMPVYLDERNKVLVSRDCFPARLPVAAIAAFLLIFLRFARRGAWRQTGYALEGWRDGLLDRRGPPAWLEV